MQLAVIQALRCHTSAGQRSTHSGLRRGSDLPRPQKKRTPTPVPSTGQDEAQRLLGKKSLRWSTARASSSTLPLLRDAIRRGSPTAPSSPSNERQPSTLERLRKDLHQDRWTNLRQRHPVSSASRGRLLLHPKLHRKSLIR